MYLLLTLKSIALNWLKLCFRKVKRAIRAIIPFKYLLEDSWFTCTGLVNFVSNSHKKFHLLAMAKMENTKYVTKKWGKSLLKQSLES